VEKIGQMDLKLTRISVQKQNSLNSGTSFLLTRGEQALFNLEIKKKSRSSINSGIYYSRVPSSEFLSSFYLIKWRYIFYKLVVFTFSLSWYRTVFTVTNN